MEEQETEKDKEREGMNLEWKRINWNVDGYLFYERI